jgi:hypothetical protein
MDSHAIHAVASRVLDDVYSASPSRPNARNGEPAWFYDMCSRIATLVGSEEVRYVSHTLDDRSEQDGVVWLFTDSLVIVSRVKGSRASTSIDVVALGRNSLTRLEVMEVSDAFKESGLDWPQRLRVDLSFQDGQTVSLPLERDSRYMTRLAALVPSLAHDLNR